jgi:hypothetical protein
MLFLRLTMGLMRLVEDRCCSILRTRITSSSGRSVRMDGRMVRSDRTLTNDKEQEMSVVLNDRYEAGTEGCTISQIRAIDQ